MKINTQFVFFIFFIFSFSACKVDKEAEQSIAIVNYSFSGCFASGKSKLVIYKKKDELFAEMEENGEKLKAKLSNLQLDTFKTFFLSLKKLDDKSLCTTVEIYKVNYNNETIIRKNAGCDWNGFTQLTKCLFSDPFIQVK